MVREARFVLARPDGEKIAVYHWTSGQTPRAVAVVAHGMGEHAGRYKRPMADLIADGIDVYAMDHRGHGATIDLGDRDPGDFGPGGFNAVARDVGAVIKLARLANPGLPVLLIGHSMGSFISQAVALEHSGQLAGLVLIGTASVDVLMENLADEPDVLAAFNRCFEPARTQCDWLSRDPDEVDAYIADPLCGFSLVPASMATLAAAGSLLADPSALKGIRRSLPILIMVGSEDPVATTYGRYKELVKRYKTAGLDPSTLEFSHARHEILNETNEREVVAALLSWVNVAISNDADRAARSDVGRRATK
ncbi:alpha/beta fold hydrolase [Gimibacter soli]|uniref:Alpha/beta fold hydrolase n=1 Tax=Gimibacter soli TaxID=3024400 RepID=A0AAE9XQT5_9PROT|nr:alpha/beta fold hydrolase [Gimibacter soli]WCL55598.1 alpha/beta fold hydrolase [Gimibacter soli]